jgi:hypothetical protein
LVLTAAPVDIITPSTKLIVEILTTNIETYPYFEALQVTKIPDGRRQMADGSVSGKIKKCNKISVKTFYCLDKGE